MEIRLAKSAGFCFGVERAVNTVYELLKDESNHPVYTYGPIVHNREVVGDLERRGVRVLNTPEEIRGIEKGTIVIRAHGVSEEISRLISARPGVKCVDATCPFVRKIHKTVSENSDENSVTLIAGDKTHPEVIGIRSYCNGDSFVFNNEEELDEIINSNPDLDKKHLILVAQTTFSIKSFEKYVKKIKK